MAYFIIAGVVMFVASVFVFVLHNKSPTKDESELTLMLLRAAIASFSWVFTIPAVVILGGAWLVAKLISKLFSLDWKSKDEPNSNN